MPSSALTRAAAALIRPSQWTTGAGIGCPETGKFSTAFGRLRAPELASVTRRHRVLPRRWVQATLRLSRGAQPLD